MRADSHTRVDIWHCDAVGICSGYPYPGDMRNISAKGERYLRGTQTTSAKGIVTFMTIYPGWCRAARCTSTSKLFLDEKTVLTGQVHFPDEIGARI